MRNQTIGVEIEFTGVTRADAAKAVAEYFGTRAHHRGGDYDSYTVRDGGARIWKVVRDTSIKAQKKAANGAILNDMGLDYKCELVTPILKYEDIETLQEVVRAIRESGGFVNKSCGLHVHIGAANFTAQKIRNLVNAVASKEDLLCDALKFHPNRETYCRKTNKRFLKELNQRKPETVDELAKIWYNERTDAGVAGRTLQHYDDTRYTIVNLHSFFTKGTIEFRVFNSTLHAGKVKAAIQFCLALTHQALTTTKAAYKPTVTDNPKYTFRCWLLRLGLNGEEFQTCRYHLLKELEGNSAWRHAATA